MPLITRRCLDPMWHRVRSRILASRTLLCRGCLGALSEGSEAGLCGACWSGLQPLEHPRCAKCALQHSPQTACPDPVEWSWGDSLWDYHGGRPPLGALLLPGIKAGELGWKEALLRRAARVPLPAFAGDADLVTAAPTAFHRRWQRGFDLAEELARGVAERLQLPFRRCLRKGWRHPRQAVQSESARRRLPGKVVGVRADAAVAGLTVLLVDDVWTTGTTLRVCARALLRAGAREVRVLTLFRAL